MNRPDVLSLLSEQVLIFDGATGSNLQLLDLSVDDFEGAEGCNEVLSRTRPDVVRRLHESFFEVGCQVVETNTFGATSVVLAEYDLQAEAHALNRRSAELAREVADGFSTPFRKRYVAGSMGPTTKLPSLSHIGFDDLAASYEEQAAGLLEGGVDLLSVETCQDLLQTRAAVHGVRRAFAAAGRRVPVLTSVTMELSGAMLLGTEPSAALAALAPLKPDLIGLNCATGPLEMKRHLGLLSRRSPVPIAAMPNAGMPENQGGETVYPLTPEELGRWHRSFILEEGVQVVGGCCGTTPAHLAEVVRQVASLTPAPRQPRPEPAVTSLYSAVPLDQEPRPLLVGERANANGSKKFRKLINAGDLDGMVALARDQEKSGAHALDVCVAYVGRDEVEDARQVVERFRGEVRLPLVIDSTQPEVMEAALKRIGGRCVLNSINLEDGEERARQVLTLARDFGAAVVALTIDEQGMARDTAQKLAVARRLYDLATGEFGLAPEDLIFDMLTFTVCSGDPDLRNAAVQTLDAIEQLKADLPGVYTILGVSNISFGLKPKSRHALNSVFLHMAVERGLDMAIVEAKKIVPLNRLDQRTRELAEDLLLDRGDGDTLGAYMKHFEAVKVAASEEQEEDTRPLPERIHAKVVDGDRTDMELLLATALTRHAPLEIINEMLIPAMGEVGELFGSGQMQLPFVLLSAEVMKHAVSILEPLMEKSDASHRGTIILATVKGDVHDIGKNLVDIMLSNNGYRVVNLGIKVPVEEMIRAYTEEQADAIGMSGLLVKSTVVMKENLAELRRRGLNPPVLLGGAALTRRYVNQDLREDYGPKVAYAKDPFEGMDLMARATAGELDAPAPAPQKKPASDIPTLAEMREKRRGALTFSAPPEGIVAHTPPTPPFWGTREVEMTIESVLPLINEDVLFRARWQYLRRKLDDAAYKEIIETQVRPMFEKLKEQVSAEGLMSPRGVYGYLPCRAEGNALVVLDGPGGSERARLQLPRQLKPPHHCIADFFQGGEAGDVLACFVVTVGQEVSHRIKELYEAHAYRDYLHLHGLSVDTAEATAERLHQIIRHELDIHHQDAESAEDLFRCRYQGCRYSFGYPACPDLDNQRLLFDLLEPGRAGVSLTSSLQMVPEQSVSAIVTHHPSARYFAV